MNINQLKSKAEEEIKKAENLKDLDEIFKKYLGKTGEITRVLSSLKGLPETKRKSIGKGANLAKIEIEKMIREKSAKLKDKARRLKLEKEKIDVTRPGKKIEKGHLHPLTLVQREIEEIFQSLGFSVVLGPEVETEWYNFDALNIPEEHPARDMWDTFWLLRNQKIPNSKSQILNKFKIQNPKSQKLLLRTHTSPVQVRYMEKHNPPLRIIVPGRCFRREATDASHEMQFYQLEGLMVDKNVSAANFKAIIEEFLKRFFKTDIEIRLRPSYFPFVEPGFEIDVRKPKGEWVEMMGAGMVHPNVLKAVGYPLTRASSEPQPNSSGQANWQGFAFGMGIDRLAMLRYKINDIRLFYSGDLRFLKQF